MENYDIIVRAEEIKKKLYAKKIEILEVLQKTETRKTAEEEFLKSIHCLNNVGEVACYLLKKKISILSTFLPINLPLYSLMLFVIIPGFRFQRVYYRPALLTQDVYKQLSEMLELKKYGWFCESISRKSFYYNYVLKSKAIIYSGKYENAINLLNTLSQDIVFIFQGSGTNPIVITEKTTISDEMIVKIMSTQLFNSGQDCMAPSVIFVEASQWPLFVKRLIAKCEKLRIGDYTQLDAEVSRIVDRETLKIAHSRITSSEVTVLYGGIIDYDTQIVMPTILSYTNMKNLPTQSSFSPIFSLYCYNNENEILQYLRRSECKVNRAYISVFGEMKLTLDDEIVIMDDVLDSIDDGISEFGGYGEGSGFISFHNHRVSKPILIAKELASFEEIEGDIVYLGF